MNLPSVVIRKRTFLPAAPSGRQWKDYALVALTAAVAGCGMLYQYLISQYTGRVLGMYEHSVFLIIGLMICSMGLGAFAARRITNPYTGFIKLELLIAFAGATGLLLIGGAITLSKLAPQWFEAWYDLPPGTLEAGGFFKTLEGFARVLPFIIAFALGALIGAEIPLIAKVREDLHGGAEALKNNVGTVYGADYIGAGAGAFVFVLFLLAAPPETTAAATAAVNLLCGGAFLLLFREHITRMPLYIILHLLTGAAALWLFFAAADINRGFEDMLYRDKVVHSARTEYQHITLTKRDTETEGAIYNLYLNGRLQFSTKDEAIYHNMLVYPAMVAADKTADVLIIGGGDGMAARDALKAGAERVTVLELDRDIIALFSGGKTETGEDIAKLNDYVFNNPRVRVIGGNAYYTTEGLIAEKEKFDAVIVDLPDPSHPDLNLLYSVPFYRKLNLLLHSHGVMAVQSTSPYEAKKAFLTVGVTMKEAGFSYVERYRQNIPSFGEWGWTIGVKDKRPARQRIFTRDMNPPSDSVADKRLILASFVFPPGFFDAEQGLEPNRPGTHLMYLLHKEAWLASR